jgi:diguanylate cyclase (GGDEF)-like protein/PAS domain S-box-containing protein
MNHKVKTAVSMVLWLALLLTSTVTFSSQAPVSAPLEKVTLQLKWLHQFQFAGYYAAKEQGYYAAEGLDVTIFERSPHKDVVEQVVSGERDFAVGDSGIVSYYARGEPIVALAAIFQHNPLVFISKQSSGIISPYEMKGKRIMFDTVGAGDSPLRAVLADARLTEKDYTAVKHSFRNADLIKDKVDVMSAYLSDEIFYFQQKNIKINIINPQNYSIDFYGDMLFTSQNELTQHQGRAEKFRRATLKGWQYALDHPEELIQLIHKKYHSKLSIANLRFEAEVTRKLILPDVIPLGQIDTGRLRKVAEVYAHLNISKSLSELKLGQFISQSNRSDDKPLIIGSEQDFPPFALGKTDATADGFTVELWRAVAEEAHLKSTIRVLPWNQILDEFKAEKIDVLINFAPSDERRQFADFTVPHVIVNEAIFVRDDEKSIHLETDLNNKRRFIVVKGDFAQEYLQAKGLEKQTLSVDTVEAGLRLLADGHYDAMLASNIVGKQTLRKLNISNVKTLPIDLNLSLKLSFAVHKGDAELLAKINEALAITKANGTYDKLYEKWFGVYDEKQLLPLVIKYLAPIIIVFLLLLLVIFYRHHLERQQAIKLLAQRERHLRAIIEEATGCVKLVARDGTLLSMNPSGLATIEADSEDMVRNHCVYSLIAPEYRAAYQAFNESVCDGESGNMEFELIGLKGTRHWMVTHAVPFNLENGDCVQLAFTQEITERKQIEERLRILSVAVEQSPTSIVISDLNGDLLYVNPRFTQVTGYSAEEAIGQNPRILKSGLTADEVYKQLWDSLIHGKVWHGELINRRKNGETYWEEVHIAPVKNSTGNVTHYVGVKVDISERKAAEEKIKQLAFFDPLTGLPNRRKLLDRLQYAIALNHRTNSQFAVFMLDLDKFKAVNDRLGHAAGDELLKQVAARITHCLRDSDMVARLGGDEFILVLENLNIPEDAETIALKLIADLTVPFQLSENDSVQIGASIGISIYPQHGSTPEQLMDHADTALYQAKENGSGCFAHFSEVLKKKLL